MKRRSPPGPPLRVPAPLCPELPFPIDVQALASHLEVSEGSLWHRVKTTQHHYTVHTIPKKSGKSRVIHAPKPHLAYIQRQILKTFLNPLEYPEHVRGFVPGRGLRSAAELHAGRPVLIALDIRDFFHATRRSWVRDALDEVYGFMPGVSYVLSSLMTVPMAGADGVYRRAIPQGAPTSGAMANLVAMQRLDPLVMDAVAPWGLTYTRYADDLALSSPTEIPREAVSEIIQKVIAAVKESGYRINHDKTRVLRPHRQQRLLGMSINEKPNVPKKDFRRACALAHAYRSEDTRGFESAEAMKSYLEGLIAYYKSINPNKAAQVARRLSG